MVGVWHFAPSAGLLRCAKELKSHGEGVFSEGSPQGVLLRLRLNYALNKWGVHKLKKKKMKMGKTDYGVHEKALSFPSLSLCTV